MLGVLATGAVNANNENAARAKCSVATLPGTYFLAQSRKTCPGLHNFLPLLTIILINPILQGENSLDSSARRGPCDLDQ
jgi:hypothetical protein